VVQRGEGLWLQLLRGWPGRLRDYSEIDGYGFRSLEEDQHVEFEVTQGPRGTQATTSAPPEPRQASLLSDNR
jgi:hypothetical protein